MGAVADTEQNSYYATPGTSQFITAPGGSFLKQARGVLTPNLATGADSTCTDTVEGTSWSAPIVAGCVALVLQAREELTWYVTAHCFVSDESSAL